VVVQAIRDIFYLLTLELKAWILRLLFSLSLAYELFKIVDFLGQVFIDVFHLGRRHLGNCIPFTIKNSDLFSAEIEFLARLSDLILKFLQIC